MLWSADSIITMMFPLSTPTRSYRMGGITVLVPKLGSSLPEVLCLVSYYLRIIPQYTMH